MADDQGAVRRPETIEELQQQADRLREWIKRARRDPSVEPAEFAAVIDNYRTLMARMAAEITARGR